MKSICRVAAMAQSALSPTLSRADVENFDKTSKGTLPDGWIVGVTGTGLRKWAVIADSSASSSANVLNQSRTKTYPWTVKKDVVLGDGSVKTTFKAISSREDQAAGVIGWCVRSPCKKEQSKPEKFTITNAVTVANPAIKQASPSVFPLMA